MEEFTRERMLERLIDNRPRLLRLIYSLSDLQFSLSALTWFREAWDPDGEVTELEVRKLRCFESAMVISFMRPFAQSRKGTVLNRKSIGISFTDGERALIQKLEAVRNDFISHADQDKMNFRVDPFQLDPVTGISVPQITFDDRFHFTSD